MKKKKWIFTFLFLVEPALGAEMVEFYTGIRQLGMGGVVVATVNDETALISNPAALGKLRDAFVTIADPELTSNGPTYGMGTEGAFADVFDPFKVYEYLTDEEEDHSKDAIYAKGQIFPSVVLKNFGFGFFGKMEYSAYIDEDADEDEAFKYNYTNDYAAILGYNLRIWEGRIKIGFSGRAINRIEMHESFDSDPTQVTEIDSSDYVKEGVGIAGDAGIILTGPWTWLPSIAAVWRDIGHTKFNQNDGLLLDTEERPDIVHSTVDVGFSITPLLSNFSRVQIAGEYRDVTMANKDTDPMKRIHAGIEFNFYDALFFRGGMNQRYWTAGMEIALGILQFQVASYGEEIGTAENPREDRRYLGKLAIRF
ncbi:MAG: hypothetical protein KDD25_04170 [Bdellovibrionales bacterium]|nr:hypothetical protein [Bdellovibrionales bacterium]